MLMGRRIFYCIVTAKCMNIKADNTSGRKKNFLPPEKIK
jgi:hypothetical protein